MSPEALHGVTKSLDFADVLGLQTLLALGDFELNPVTFVEGLKSIRLNRGEVDEYVLASILGNETKTLLVLKPLHSTLCHAATTFLLIKILIIHGGPEDGAIIQEFIGNDRKNLGIALKKPAYNTVLP